MTTHTYKFDPSERKPWPNDHPGPYIGSTPRYSTLRIQTSGPVQAAANYLANKEVTVAANLSDGERRAAIGDKLNDDIPSELGNAGYYFLLTPSEPNGNDWASSGADWVHLAHANKICWEVHPAHAQGSYQLYAKAEQK